MGCCGPSRPTDVDGLRHAEESPVFRVLYGMTDPRWTASIISNLTDQFAEGEDVNEYCAVRYDCSACGLRSVSEYSEIGPTPLLVAAHAGNSAMVDFLIAAGADVNAYADCFPMNGDVRADIQYLSARLLKPTALHLAVLEGHYDIATTLIGHGAITDAEMLDGAEMQDGLTPEMLARQAGRMDDWLRAVEGTSAFGSKRSQVMPVS